VPTDPTVLTGLPTCSEASSIDAGDHRARLEEEVVNLVSQFRGRLLHYLSGFGLPISDGEDIVQEVFLSLFQHLLQRKSRHNLRGWVFQVTHNLALRRRGQSRRHEEVTEAVEDLAIDPYPNPEDRMVYSQTQRRLLAVVRALPEQDRQCLVLRAEGLGYREIARILDMSLGAVSLSVARSLARIARSAER